MCAFCVCFLVSPRLIDGRRRRRRRGDRLLVSFSQTRHASSPSPFDAAARRTPTRRRRRRSGGHKKLPNRRRRSLPLCSLARPHSLFECSLTPHVCGGGVGFRLPRRVELRLASPRRQLPPLLRLLIVRAAAAGDGGGVNAVASCLLQPKSSSVDGTHDH